jgi:membrane protein YdbS with pleckstrin-like domain
MDLPVALQPGETVVLRVRRHPIYVTLKLAAVTLVAVVPVALALWLANRTAGMGSTAGRIVLAVCAVWLLYWLVRGYFIWYRHEHDQWMVTNQRLIDSYKRHWFDHRVSSADLVNVQDISVHRSGLLATLFNFGDVRCQTAGTESVFVLSAIPRPAEVLGIVDAARDAARLDAHRGPRPQTGAS